MANNTEVIFEDIEQRIITEIESAHYAIFVSVAWFTNKKLFNALLEKANVSSADLLFDVKRIGQKIKN